MSGDPLDWLFPNGGAPQPTPEEDKAEQERQLLAMQQAEDELNQLVASVMTQGRGPELMAWLRDCTIECSLLKMNTPAGMIAGNEFPLSPSDWAYVRAGQNSMTHELERRIALALRPAAQPAPATENDGA